MGLWASQVGVLYFGEILSSSSFFRLLNDDGAERALSSSSVKLFLMISAVMPRRLQVGQRNLEVGFGYECFSEKDEVAIYWKRK
jgi:hypothetical protein